MDDFVCSVWSPTIAFILAALYLAALAIDMKREEREESKR